MRKPQREILYSLSPILVIMSVRQTERELLIRLRQGDRKAFDEIYEQWSGYVYNFICKTLYNKALAEDITQELFLRLWKHRSQIDEQRNFEAWIFTIARNLVYKEGRRMVLSSAFAETVRKEAGADTDRTTEDMVNFSFVNEQVNQLIEQLPPARRRIYLLNKMDGLSIREIAARLNLSEKTVETQLYHANVFLRSRLRNTVLVLALIILGINF